MKITIETARQLYWSGNKEFRDIALSQFTEKEVCGDYSLLVPDTWVSLECSDIKLLINFERFIKSPYNIFLVVRTLCRETWQHQVVINAANIINISLPTAEEWEQIYQAYPEERPKKQFPKFEEIGKIKGYRIDSFSHVVASELNTSFNASKNIWPSKELAEAALALSQLCQLRDYVNDGWKPTFNNQVRNHAICVNQGMIDTVTSLCHNRVLAFKTPEIRDGFMKAYKELLEIAKPLL